ncbi:MAG TPA: radical SAM/SPASM domain-containing protein [Spirochaetota bacterium]
MKRFSRIYLELTDTCNLRCPFCAQGRHGNEIPCDKLDDIIVQIAQFTDEVRPHVLGEPLLYPHFGYFLSLCEKYNLTVKITTNGTLLTVGNINLLQSKSIREINLSLHSFSSDTHGAIDAYLDILISLCDHPAIIDAGTYINFRFWNLSPEYSTKDTTDLFEALLAHYRCDLDIPRGGRGSIRLADRRRISFDEPFEWPSSDRPVQKETGFCLGTISQIGILSDGRVTPCCLDSQGEITLGNLFETPLAEIVGGQRITMMKEGFEKGNLVENLCKGCSFIERFGKKKSGNGSPRDLGD